jgi:hypothetical protein
MNAVHNNISFGLLKNIDLSNIIDLSCQDGFNPKSALDKWVKRKNAYSS